MSSADRTQRAPGLSAAALANVVVVGRSPMANMLFTSRDCPRGWIAEVAEVIGGAGPTPWRVWRTPARWVSPAGADMGGRCGGGGVRSGRRRWSPWGLLGPSQGWIPPPSRSGCGVGSVARDGRRPGPGSKHLSGGPERPGEIEFHVQGSRNHRASQTEEEERPERLGPGPRSPGRPEGELLEGARARLPESGHHARPADRLGHEEGSHPPCGHLVQPARSVMTARGRPARGRPAHLRATGFLAFGLPVLWAGRHWGSPVGSSSLSLSLPTGPQVLFSDKRRPFSSFRGRLWPVVRGPVFGAVQGVSGGVFTAVRTPA